MVHQFENIALLDELGQRIEQLQREALSREKAQAELSKLNQTLEQRISERTQVLKVEIEHRKHTEQKLSAITESAQEAIVMIDDEGRVVYWNRAAERITGYVRLEALGGNIITLMVPERFRETQQRALAHFRATGEGAAVGRTLELVALHKNGEDLPVELSISAVQLQERWHAIGLMRDMSERKRLEAILRKSRNTFRTVVDNLPQRIIYKDNDSTYVSGNRRYAVDLGVEPRDLPGKTDFDFFPRELAEKYRSDDRRIIESGAMEEIEERYFNNGEERFIHTVRTPLRDEDGNPSGVLGIFWDITDQKRAEQARKNMEVQLRQAQKLEAVGQLAAGIAHEINTPSQFVNDNTHFLKDAFEDYARFVDASERLTDAVADGTFSEEQLNLVKALAQEIDIAYLREEIPQAVEQSLEGLDRIGKIVRAMKEFSHPGTELKAETDLNRAILTTVDVSRNEWKYYAALNTELDPELPPVAVLPGEFNQVILNLIVNAAHAIDDAVAESGDKGEIRIATRRDGDWAEIRVIDTGRGIPDAIQKRIFDPFFTTKEVGKGSGQGLAIAWSVIVDKHGGTIAVESEEGKGATFTVRLPIMRNPMLENDT